MGEVGINWREYLYDLQFWQIMLIARGYLHRHHPGWEQARLIAYNAAFAFGSKNRPPEVQDWLPFPWEKSPMPTEDEVEQIRSQILAENAKIQSKQ